MSKLVLFTNSYPYGPGETFLHEELPIVASRFKQVVIYPLYIPGGVNHIGNTPVQQIPDHVIVKRPLIGFDHKDKKMLALNGLMPHFFDSACKEFLGRKVYLSGKKIWIFFNYTLLRNAILTNWNLVKEVLEELKGCQVAYFYWGDKSALLVPYLKRKLGRSAPPFVVRFHGSDLYEEAKGYLPYRKSIYKNTDYAIPISHNGAAYIREHYQTSLPRQVIVHRLGSQPHPLPPPLPATEYFHVVSCSNVIELKRVELIAKALLKIEQDFPFIERMAEAGFKKIKWTHLGDGPLLEEIKGLFKEEKSVITAVFPGRIPHEQVLDFYNTHRNELFVQVSRSEGVPVSIMEALSFGIPVLATDVGGVSELFATRGSLQNTANPQNPSGKESTTCLYGTLLPKDLTVEALEKAIKAQILLPDTQQELARAAARAEWETNWNAEKNYTTFADFLQRTVARIF